MNFWRFDSTATDYHGFHGLGTYGWRSLGLDNEFYFYLGELSIFANNATGTLDVLLESEISEEEEQRSLRDCPLGTALWMSTPMLADRPTLELPDEFISAVRTGRQTRMLLDQSQCLDGDGNPMEDGTLAISPSNAYWTPGSGVGFGLWKFVFWPETGQTICAAVLVNYNEDDTTTLVVNTFDTLYWEELMSTTFTCASGSVVVYG